MKGRAPAALGLAIVVVGSEATASFDHEHPAWMTATSGLERVQVRVQGELAADLIQRFSLTRVDARFVAMRAVGPEDADFRNAFDLEVERGQVVDARTAQMSYEDAVQAFLAHSTVTQSQQSYGGAITTPGTSQVDLRGLGPNHTLVMIDGKRVADFPMPYQGLSNYADVSNIPVSMIERIEVLSGSASAIYGSDAVAGVINFTLKKKPDGTSFSYRYGGTEHGGNESSLFSFSTGYEKDKFSIVYGLEVQDKLPLWQYERDIQDSTLDAPTSRRRRAQYVFARYDLGH